jgi:DNA-binding NtrC family response regulator
MTETRRNSPRGFYALVDGYERQLLTQALEQAFGDEKEAARALGLSLTVFQLKADRLDVDRRKHRLQPPPGPRAEW